jgi:hypothetical protein
MTHFRRKRKAAAHSETPSHPPGKALRLSMNRVHTAGNVEEEPGLDLGRDRRGL